MKRILVYGIAGWEPEKEVRSALLAIKNLGFRSIFVCNRENPTMRFADRSVVNPNWDYSLLRKVADEEAIDFAWLISDFASPLIGRLNRELNLPGPSDIQYDQVADKIRWSELARAHGIKMPREHLVLNREDFQSWNYSGPIIVKPTKSTGNLSPEPFGYQYFNSISDLENKLVQNGWMEKFLEINRNGSHVGRYLIQERLEYVFWGNLGISFFNDKFVLNEMHSRLFRPFPNQIYQYASVGPVPLSKKISEHALSICALLRNKIGIKNTGLSLDVIETPDGDLYTVDINARFGSTWTTFLPIRKIQYLEAALSAFLDLPFQLPVYSGSFLRRKVDLPAGTIQSIQWPADRDPRLQLEGHETFVPGTKIPELIGHHMWPIEAFITAESQDECFRIYDDFRQSIDVKTTPVG